MDDQLIIAYCDGACSGNPGPGGWGAVILYPDNGLQELGGAERPSTNNRMEMVGAIAVLKTLTERPEKLRLYTDSGYLIQGITQWIFGWKRKGWKTMDGKDVLNRDLWELLDRLAAGRRDRLEWKHVKGHSGHEVNERCDEIAVGFSKGMPVDLYDGQAVGCGYSLLEPDTEHMRVLGTSKAKSKGGFYVSLVGGKAERHMTWPECQTRVHGVSGARFKKVSTPDEEQAVLKSWGAA